MSGGTACSVVVVVEIDSYIAENKIDPKKSTAMAKRRNLDSFCRTSIFLVY